MKVPYKVAQFFLNAQQGSHGEVQSQALSSKKGLQLTSLVAGYSQTDWACCKLFSFSMLISKIENFCDLATAFDGSCHTDAKSNKFLAATARFKQNKAIAV